MVCAGITYNAGTKRVTITYNVADLTKGASFSNHYNFDDLYDTDVANGWGVFVKTGTKLYIAYCSIYIAGAATYFQDGNYILYYVDNGQEVNLFYALSTNIRLIPEGATLAYIISTIVSTPYRRLYVGNGNCTLEGVSIEGFAFADYYAGSYKNLQIRGGNNNIRANVIIDGITFILHNGYTVYGIPASCINMRFLSLARTSRAFDLISSGTFTFSNTYFSPDTAVQFYMRMGIVYELILIDSNADLATKYQIIGVASTTGAVVTLKTTFSGTIENGAGGTLTIRDKNGVTVYTEILTSDNMISQVIEYQRRTITANGSAITSNIYALSEPFSLVISKSGYQNLEISNISVTGGVQTIIRGELIRPELLISAVEITDTTAIGASDGVLTITAEGGDGTYQYSINGTDYQASNEFTGLPAELYTLYAKDGEDVIATFDVEINDPIYKNVYIDRTVSGAISATQINDSVQLTKQIGGRVSVNTSAQVSGTVQKTKSISGTVEKKVAGTIQPTKQISGTITVKTL